MLRVGVTVRGRGRGRGGIYGGCYWVSACLSPLSATGIVAVVFTLNRSTERHHQYTRVRRDSSS